MPVPEVSLGDYVLSGGEVAVLVIVEAVARLLPGVIGNAESLLEESHATGAGGLLEAPGYTKPRRWRGRDVPDVLLSGHHAPDRPLAPRPGAAPDRGHAAPTCCSGWTQMTWTSGSRGARRAEHEPALDDLGTVAVADLSLRQPRAGPRHRGRLSDRRDCPQPARRPWVTCGTREEATRDAHASTPSTPPRCAPTSRTSAPATRSRSTSEVIEGNRSRIQVFQGVVIRRQGGGVRETFTVRKVSFGVGVERTFPVHTPVIDKIEVVTRGDVRRAKLYYLRDLRGKAAKIKEKRETVAR